MQQRVQLGTSRMNGELVVQAWTLWLAAAVLLAGVLFLFWPRPKDNKPPAVRAMYDALPSDGSSMSEKTQRRWITGMKTILAHSYKET